MHPFLVTRRDISCVCEERNIFALTHARNLKSGVREELKHHANIAPNFYFYFCLLAEHASFANCLLSLLPSYVVDSFIGYSFYVLTGEAGTI